MDGKALMAKLLFDLFPIVLFFVSYSLINAGLLPIAKQEAIFYATGVAIIATIAQIIWVYVRHKKVDNMLWVSLGLIVVLGGATILLHDKHFVMWKPTVLYWIFSAVLLISLLLKKNLIKKMMQAKLSLPEHVWNKLNLSWVAFFAFMGTLNLYVAYNFSEQTWVQFKMFGTLGLMLVFIFLQSLMLSKYMSEESQ